MTPSIADPRTVERMFRRLTTTQVVVDAVAGGVWFLINALPAGWNLGPILLALGMGAVLVIRRLSPAIALLAAWGVALVQVAAGGTPMPADLAILPMLFACAAYGTPSVRWAGFGSTFVGAAVATVALAFPSAITATLRGRWPEFAFRGGSLLSNIVLVGVVFGFLVTVFLLSWTAGILFRTWRQSRANRSAAAEAEREVVAEQERTRIARDMHDVVAHSLAVVVAQADGARYLRRQDPDAVDEALQTIATTARDALADVRVLLAQLRHAQADGPQPTMGDLDRLLDQLRAAGLTIRREESGTPLVLGTGQQLAVFRIAQESLTNALRHADRSQEVVLHLGWSPHGLDVVVTSALAAHPAPAGSGHGISGMTERAALAGGHLTARAGDDRFVVHAWLPVPAGVPT
jgi:signal transduction histidine kinase